MQKYLFKATYTLAGTQGLLKEGGTARRNVIAQMIEGVGGRLESFNFAFGGDDVFCVVELPDPATAAAASLNIAATGASNVQTVVLITPEEMDKATKVKLTYRKPGV